MTKFILHGGFARDANAINDGFFAEIRKDLPQNATILVVLFARKDAEQEEIFQFLQGALQKGAAEKRLNFVLATEKDFIEQLRGADALFLHGGETNKLLAKLKNYPNFTEAIKGKTVVGSSAGAYVLSKYFHSASQGDIHEGLGILPIKTICHYESPKFEVRDDAIVSMAGYPHDLDLVVLKDYEWKVVTR